MFRRCDVLLFSETYTEIVESLQNKTLIVTTIMVIKIQNIINSISWVYNANVK